MTCEPRQPALPPSGELGAVLALASLPEVTPARLRTLVAGGEPERVVRAIAGGTRVPEPACNVVARLSDDQRHRWRAALSQVDLDEVVAEHHGAGVSVALVGDHPQWSAVLADMADPPVLVCWRGDLDQLERRRVGIVGTRACTRYGREVAAELGRDLGDAGVAVVSGLAMGIDAAAHNGALSVDVPAVVGVVANGLDVTYPRASAALYRRVVDTGLLVSEYPLGRRPAQWQFLARNRIIAAIAEVVVVVESHERGGALSTAETAAGLGRPVLAVPGSVRSPASSGANSLLADGAEPCRNVDDLLMALGLHTRAPARSAGDQLDSALDPQHRAILDAMGWQPATIDQLVLRCSLSVAQVALAVEELAERGLLARAGGFVERTTVAPGPPGTVGR